MGQRVVVRFLAAFILLVCLPPLAFSLSPEKKVTQYVLDSWSTGDGLPELSVHAILQTKDGYLWIGTEEGLARFDGVRFVIFDKENTDAIKGNFINALYESSDGALWIGTAAGLTRMKNGQFTHYGSADGLSNDHVICFYEDRNAALWIGTTNGLCRFVHDKFETFRTHEGFPDDWITSLADDHAGGIWAGTPSGVARWQSGHLVLQNLPDVGTVYSLYSAGADDLWIGSYKDLKHYSHGSFVPIQTDRQLQNEPVQAIYPDRDGNLWIATLGEGLMRFHNGALEGMDTKNGMLNNMIQSLYEDREGSLWVGTSEGLNRIKDGSFVSYSVEEGLSDKTAWCIREDSKNRIWIGTDRGLNVLDHGILRVFTMQDGLSSNVIASLAEDGQGNLWIGTLGGGLNRLSDDKFIRYTAEDGLAAKWIWSIQPDREGALWIGTFARGIGKGTDGKFTSYNKKNGFPADSVHWILESPDGALYFATQGNGLIRRKDDSVTEFGAKQGLSGTDISSLYMDAQQNLWIPSIGQGLFLYKDGVFKEIAQKNGLPADTFHAVLEDNLGNLWISSNRGIFKVAKKDLLAFASGKSGSVNGVLYGKSDGMKSSECNGGYQPAAWKSQDGRLWFATLNGVAVVDPRKLQTNRLPPPVKIEEIIVDRQLVADSGAAFDFSPGKENFEFHYTALSLLAPEKVHFKYKLEGFDEDWINAGNRRVAFYTHLPPGKYSFKVQACNNDGIWNEAGATLAFRLQPHFYQTEWFVALCAAAIILAGIGLHRYRLRRIQSRFDAILAERNRIARELHDTVAQGTVGIIAQLNAAEEVHTNSPGRVLHHVERARDLAKQNLVEARQAIRALRPQFLEKGDFDAALRRVANDLAGNTAVRVDVRIDASQRELPAVVEDNLLRVAQEAVTNALRYSQAKTLLVEFRIVSRNAQLRIVDDGIGFDTEKARALDGHFGLVGMRERAKQLGGEFSVVSSPGKGTEISVTIPLS